MASQQKQNLSTQDPLSDNLAKQQYFRIEQARLEAKGKLVLLQLQESRIRKESREKRRKETIQQHDERRVPVIDLDVDDKLAVKVEKDILDVNAQAVGDDMCRRSKQKSKKLPLTGRPLVTVENGHSIRKRKAERISGQTNVKRRAPSTLAKGQNRILRYFSATPPSPVSSGAILSSPDSDNGSSGISVLDSDLSTLDEDNETDSDKSIVTSEPHLNLIPRSTPIPVHTRQKQYAAKPPERNETKLQREGTEELLDSAEAKRLGKIKLPPRPRAKPGTYSLQKMSKAEEQAHAVAFCRKIEIRLQNLVNSQPNDCSLEVQEFNLRYASIETFIRRANQEIQTRLSDGRLGISLGYRLRSIVQKGVDEWHDCLAHLIASGPEEDRKAIVEDWKLDQ